MNAPPFLPYGRQLIEDDDIAAVADVLRGDWLTTGPAVTAFEEAFAERVGAAHAVSCSSGTAALHMAVAALGIGPGDAVIVPAVTFVATANVVELCGGTVVFADVDPDSGLMRHDDFREAAQRAAQAGLRLKAVLPVHLNGQTVDMTMLRSEAGDDGILIVEDACHVLGARHGTGDNAPWVGSCAHSDVAAFSMHPLKAIAMGEGGVATCNDPTVADRLRLARNHGLSREPGDFRNRELACDRNGTPNPWYYEMHQPGLNYRASDIHCALGLSQLKKLDRFIARRAELVSRYDRLLAPLSPHVRPITRAGRCDPAWHLYVVLIDFSTTAVERAELMRQLKAQGVGTQVHYIPVHLQPFYRRKDPSLSLRGAEGYYARCLSLPLFPGMSDGDVDRVVDAISSLCGPA